MPRPPVLVADGLCEFTMWPPRTGPWLLIEVPHGATRATDYERTASKLQAVLPKNLIEFFYANTDTGAPEGAEFLGEWLSAKGWGVAYVRCTIPRTFIDVNRVLSSEALSVEGRGVVRGGLTAAIPAYIDNATDAAVLIDLHRRYHSIAAAAYALVGGHPHCFHLQLHSFAPKSVGIEIVGRDIVERLRAAYQPAVYATWPDRPMVEVIAESEDGSFRVAPALTLRLKAAYARAGLELADSVTYRLTPAAMGYEYARAYPETTMCIEMNRAAIGNPFQPFAPTEASEAGLRKLLLPLAEALVEAARL